MKMEAYTKHVAMEAELAARQQSKGIKLLKQLTARMMKGEAGMRVMLWKDATKATLEAERAERALALQAALEEQMRAQGPAQGLRILRQHMARQVRGEVGFRIEIWRTKKEDDKRAGLDSGELAERFEAQMRAQGQGRGLRLLRQIMARMVKGEKGYRLEIFRTRVKDVKRESDLARQTKALADAQNDALKGAGLRALKRTLARIAKGVLGEKVVIWKQSFSMAQYARLESMRSELKSKMDGPGQYLAMKHMRHTMARIAKGEIYLRIMVWRDKMLAQKRARELAKMRRQPAAKIKELREVIEVTVRQLLEKNLLDHCPELKLAVEREQMRTTALRVGCKMMYMVMLQILKVLGLGLVRALD